MSPAPAVSWLSRAGRAPTALIALALFVTYAYFVAPAAWNENSRFDLVRSLVERQRVDIDPYHHNTGDKARRGAHTYSDKAPGAAFLAVVPYAIYWGFLHAFGRALPDSSVRTARGDPEVTPLAVSTSETGGFAGTAAPGGDDEASGEDRVVVNLAFRKALYVCTVFTSGLAGACLGAGLFVLLCGLGLPQREALLSAMVMGLGSLVFPYATMLYGHVLAAALLFGAFALLVRAKRAVAAGEVADVPAAALARAGLCAGAAAVAELPAAAAAAALALYAFTATRDRRRLGFFAAGAAPPVLLLLLYQAAAFGGPLTPGYAMVSRAEFARGMAQGLMGITYPKVSVLGAILFGRYRGLFYVSPALVLGFVGLYRMVRDRALGLRAEGVLAAVLVVYFLLMNSAYYMWSGGAALGPRHVIPMLPFLCLGIPFALCHHKRLTLVLAALSIFNQCVATAVAPEAPLDVDPLFGHAYPHFFHGRVAILSGTTNLGLMVGLPGPFSLIPLALVWFLTLRVLLPMLPSTPDDGAPAMAAADA